MDLHMQTLIIKKSGVVFKVDRSIDETWIPLLVNKIDPEITLFDCSTYTPTHPNY